MRTIEQENLVQEIAERLVEMEIYQFQTQIIEALLRQSHEQSDLPIQWEDVENATDQEGEPQEIYEWWCCSDWLAWHLAKRGHPVLRITHVGRWWGRTCTGQAIKLDGDIQEIALQFLATEEEKQQLSR